MTLEERGGGGGGGGDKTYCYNDIEIATNWTSPLNTVKLGAIPCGTWIFPCVAGVNVDLTSLVHHEPIN